MSARRGTAAVAVLLIGGTLAAFSGLAMIGLGTAGPNVIDELLPPIPVDTAALGRGTVALGVAFALVGLLQIGAALALRMQLRWAAVVGLVLSVILAISATLSGIASLMTALGGFGPALLLLPLAGGLGVAGVAYTVASVSLFRAQAPPS